MPASDRLRSALAEHYSIERELGSGGMATVYLARDLKHDRQVALKVLRADLSAVIGTERFLAEVRIAAKLDHPHILTLIDSGSADGILYYVLPYVRGESLRAKLEREKQLGVEDALSIITQVAGALDYAHAQGVVHRDIKPENILLHQGEAVLTDFGIALAVKEASGNRLTETGLSLGTPQYMSPEQATGDRTLDRRSDVYSLGAVFYEMIAGEPPVTGANAQAVIAKLLTEKPVKLRVVRGTIPLAMERATERALAKVPADRFSSAGEFARALSTEGPESETSSTRSRINWVAIAVAAVAVIGTGLWLARGKFSGPTRTAATLRDRTQITNTGRVSLPDVSDDGKTIAYVVTDCGPRGCRYGVEMQDVAGGLSRRLLEGATAVYKVQISPDRRNILILGTVNGVYGSFIVSTLGGVAHRVVTGQATFWAGGDSLLLVRSSFPADTFWILVSGLDGVPTDSIRVEGPADDAELTAVPNSQRIMYALTKGRNVEWISADRSGKRYSSKTFLLGLVGGGKASSDALWVQTFSSSTNFLRRSIVRIPFDGSTGRFAERGDTVYTGTLTNFGVTADGGTLILDEGITEYAGWALSFEDLLKGRFTEDKRVLRGTSSFGASLSPDGNAVVVGRDLGMASREGQQWAVMPFAGGQETVIPGRHQWAKFVDSTALAIYDGAPSGARLSLLDYRTRRASAILSIPDPSIKFFTRLRGQGWAWIPAGGRTINMQRDGEPRAQKIQIPKWYRLLFNLSASSDARTIAFLGWNASDDSVGVGLLSLPDGHFTQVWSTFAEGAVMRWLADGSLLIAIRDTQESYTLYRARVGQPIERLGSTPRPIRVLDWSVDLRRAVVVTRDYHGDAWISKVVR
jgi:hypothetical protein